MKNTISVADIKSKVTEVAKDYNIRKVELFGSYAGGNQTRKSDIDLLVEFHEPSVSLLRIIGLKNKLEKMTGKSVDVIHAPIPKESFLVIDKVVPIYG